MWMLWRALPLSMKGMWWIVPWRRSRLWKCFPWERKVSPLQSPLLWREYYRLMERPNKVEMIDKALGDKSMETKCETVVAPCLPQKEEAEPS